MRWASTWMPRTSRGMTTRGGGQAERTPRDESGIPRLLKFMRDSPGLRGILRDKVGSSEISGIPRQRFLPESRPSARPTFPSSRTRRVWTLRRTPQHPPHAMPPSRDARTCPDVPGLDPGIRVSAHPFQPSPPRPHTPIPSCADLIRASISTKPAMRRPNTWMPRSSRGMTKRGRVRTERAPPGRKRDTASPQIHAGFAGIARDSPGQSGMK